MTKKAYFAPQTRRADVELEQGFMNASVFLEEKNTKGLSIDDHQVQTDLNGKFDFSEETEWK